MKHTTFFSNVEHMDYLFSDKKLLALNTYSSVFPV